jgi:LysR family transcriptional regulator, transcriptional activator of nhaA
MRRRTALPDPCQRFELQHHRELAPRPHEALAIQMQVGTVRPRRRRRAHLPMFKVACLLHESIYSAPASEGKFDKSKRFVLFSETITLRPVAHLNYHHLRYFWVIARECNLTRAARSLHVSPSALSTQLRTLEAELGQPLFDRGQKALVLSEAGKLAFEYAETIFRAGNELLDTFAGKAPARRKLFRVGSMATLSRNFQLDFIRPLLASQDVEVVLRSGNLRELLVQLEAFSVDVILSTEPVRTDSGLKLNNHLIAEYPVSLVATPDIKTTRDTFPRNIRHVPLVLPGKASSMRAAFDALIAEAGICPPIAAEVDDMAMLRLLAREGVGVALVPPVVVRDELEDGSLRELCQVPGLTKPFYAVTLQRRFPHPMVRELIARSAVVHAVMQRCPRTPGRHARRETRRKGHIQVQGV